MREGQRLNVPLEGCLLAQRQKVIEFCFGAGEFEIERVAGVGKNGHFKAPQRMAHAVAVKLEDGDK
jgi:hypothetical protein